MVSKGVLRRSSSIVRRKMKATNNAVADTKCHISWLSKKSNQLHFVFRFLDKYFDDHDFLKWSYLDSWEVKNLDELFLTKKFIAMTPNTNASRRKVKLKNLIAHRCRPASPSLPLQISAILFTM